MSKNDYKRCKCGCGRIVEESEQYIDGHKPRRIKTIEADRKRTNIHHQFID